ncbi:hypothetical protein BCD64_03920 [Nostoc sp. MBR 210]|nr:hypothetical protein BCD64_03920 [Nostoc sp. MBR 210]
MSSSLIELYKKNIKGKIEEIKFSVITEKNNLDDYQEASEFQNFRIKFQGLFNFFIKLFKKLSLG